jgi:hypothetical protein
MPSKVDYRRQARKHLLFASISHLTGRRLRVDDLPRAGPGSSHLAGNSFGPGGFRLVFYF